MQKHRRVGLPEPIDRLLDVANHKQPVDAWIMELLEDLFLQRIGVLILINHNFLKVSLQIL